MIGREVPRKELEELVYGQRTSEEPCVLDLRRNRIYLPSEFYLPQSPSGPTLRWKELGVLAREALSSANSVHCIDLIPDAGFYGLLGTLLNDLAGKSLFTKGHLPKVGDYIFKDHGAICVDLPDGKDARGEQEYSVVAYWPRREADAIEYAKYFINSRVEVARVAAISEPDKNMREI